MHNLNKLFPKNRELICKPFFFLLFLLSQPSNLNSHILKLNTSIILYLKRTHTCHSSTLKMYHTVQKIKSIRSGVCIQTKSDNLLEEILISLWNSVVSVSILRNIFISHWSFYILNIYHPPKGLTFQ